jgi:hypothetical protein
MRRVMALTLAALAAAFVARAGELRLGEDFERTQFPPAGWYRQGNETAWSRGTGPYNCYARGNLTVEQGSSWASLVTRAFALQTSGKVNLRMRYIAALAGPGEGKSTVAFRRGVNELWKMGLHAPVTWTSLTATFGPYAKGDNFNLLFKVTASTSSSMVTAILYVDDVQVRECATAVEASSLGRVKALCR